MFLSVYQIRKIYGMQKLYDLFIQVKGQIIQLFMYLYIPSNTELHVLHHQIEISCELV